ncbi:alpha/beta-hydrolase, partial [Meira miltonrushii]
AKQFEVGSDIPGLPFRTKKSWAGNIEIPDTATVKNGSLNFWLWGKDAHEPGDDIIFWMNGGPGCSSLIGMAGETGPFIFGPDGPKPNPYSWTTAATMVYVSQPVGVSFTTGINNNTNEAQISEQLALWLWKFFYHFVELFDKNVYIVGESYMGRYAAWQFDAFHKNPAGDTPRMLKGGMLISPAFSDFTVQLDTATYDFAKKNQKVLNFTNQDLASVKNESDTCNLTNFIHDHLTYPPMGRLPTPDDQCYTFDTYMETAQEKNPNFNMYNIKQPKTDSDPNTQLVKFFNRTDVQDYIHAPRQHFELCKKVFNDDNQDSSEPPDRTPSFAHSNFARMIERSRKFIIMNGMQDGLVLTAGTELALQNLTWGGAQGFNLPPVFPMCDMEGNVRAYATDNERGLRFMVAPNAGHMVPADEPSLVLNVVLSMLGR